MLKQEKICPQCTAKFLCDTGSETECWCSKFPPVMPMKSNADCYCPLCLEKAISQKIAVFLSSKQPDQTLMQQARRLGISGEPIENIDYYINKDDNWVFTAWYHLKRGQCCRNGCLHCPYGFKKQKTCFIISKY